MAAPINWDIDKLLEPISQAPGVHPAVIRLAEWY